MERINYQHLLYFWMVAREGTVAAAGARLRLAQSTLSGQIHRFEDVLGEKLFVRRGRRLALTEAGRIAFRYADEIFSLGQEFIETLRGQGGDRPVRLVVGLLDVIPKALAQQLVEPAFAVEKGIRVICREDRSLDGFLADMAVYGVDMILSDAPASPNLRLRLFNHVLGESGTSFFAAPPLAKRLRRGFPGSLEGEPFLLPGRGSSLRRLLEQWMDEHTLRPRVALEADDSGFIQQLGSAGKGVFAAPSVIAGEIERRYRVTALGRAPSLRQRFYAITAERRITNPAVLAITRAARRALRG